MEQKFSPGGALSSDASAGIRSTDASSTNALGADVPSPDVLGSDALSPEALGPDAISLDAFSLEAMEDECDVNITETLRVIGGKWKLSLLWAIHDCSMRFNEFRRRLPGISQKMLTQQLRELEEEGLVQRRVIPEKPPKVEYSLTEYGKTLRPLFDVLDEWGIGHRIRTAQRLSASEQEKPSGGGA